MVDNSETGYDFGKTELILVSCLNAFSILGVIPYVSLVVFGVLCFQSTVWTKKCSCIDTGSFLALLCTSISVSENGKGDEPMEVAHVSHLKKRNAIDNIECA